MSDKIYIVAVSGGVDSIVLLDRLVKKKFLVFEEATFVVAHFDHGVRKDSAADAVFVRDLAKQYDVPFELGEATLGPGVSEAAARAARYAFLRSVLKKYKAQAIITAHHQDDLIETAIINMIRGTGWRGLASLDSGDEIIRPLLGTSKQDILQYARENSLEWKEDSTNVDERYLRNYIRRQLLPKVCKKDSRFKQKFLEHILHAKDNKATIDTEVKHFISLYGTVQDAQVTIRRYALIMVPKEVAEEVVYIVLRQLDEDWHPSRLQLQRAVHFIKTARHGATLQISKQLHIVMRKEVVQFKKV